MSRFAPAAGDELVLDVDGGAHRFRAMPHPQGFGYVHAAEGAKAVVYRVRETAGGGYYALKVMKPRFREASLQARCAALDALKRVPGMRVCERRCLAPGTAPRALARHADLEYAVLMPWIAGQTWFEVLTAAPGPPPPDPAGSLRLALGLASALAALEARGVGHCDLSAANVIVDTRTGAVELVDVEDVYAPGLSAPGAVPLGTPGYQHRTSGAGMWRPDADRFAGAVLICEMLAWHDAAVRAASAGESFFAPSEMQDPASPRLAILLRALRAGGVSQACELLERAWASAVLGDCPSFREWERALRPSHAGTVFSGRPIVPPPEEARPFWTTLPAPRTGPPLVRWSRSTPRPAPAAVESEPDATPDD
ncbi:hypothetical protein [Longimicrobium sp.]|uniref:hypothetical protein n=1 Tax=Longimicrobium sp. TaxID=2029185 RepID=UPI002CCE92A1|nr:hypothetical protein [Longimicrobium sp.]HSU17516.1 hypothetical protein [Longimicrobium sp.]